MNVHLLTGRMPGSAQECSKLELSTHNIQKVFDKLVPTKTKIIKASKPPWFQKEVKLAINQRSKLYHK